MNRFRQIPATTFEFNPFRAIGKDWMLIAAEKDGKINAMTASWGGFGRIWEKDAAFAFIRQSRFTKEFVDAADTFSLNFLDHDKYAEMLSYMGTVSGRDEDKIAKSSLTPVHFAETPYFDEASFAVICRKMANQLLPPESFLMDWIDKRCYANHDYHTLYIGEAVAILKRD